MGKVLVGGGAPVAVQSMAASDTKNIPAVVDEIHKLESAGCEIVRAAVPDEKAAQALSKIKAQIKIPLIADIHFNHHLALMAIEQGVDGLRLNPGNIPNKDGVRTVVREAKARGIPIRIGVNAGSLNKDLLQKYGWPTAEAMVESAMNEITILEEMDFHDIKISLKSSDVLTTIAAYRLIAEKCDYPLHLGITEAGTPFAGSIKSAVGMGILLAEGIGDTIRVSLTGDTVEEVNTAFEVLKALGLRQHGPVLVACPSCGRADVDQFTLAQEVEEKLKILQMEGVNLDGIKVAVMGCEVNGPGEGRVAHFGIAGGVGEGLIFKNGKIIRKVKEHDLVDALVAEICNEAKTNPSGSQSNL